MVQLLYYWNTSNLNQCLCSEFWDDCLRVLSRRRLAAQVTSDRLAFSNSLYIISVSYVGNRSRNVRTLSAAFSILSAYSNSSMCLKTVVALLLLSHVATTYLSIISEDRSKAVGLASPFPVRTNEYLLLNKNSLQLTCDIWCWTVHSFEDRSILITNH